MNTATSNPTATAIDTPPKMPSLIIWLSVGFIGLLLMLGGLAWSWKLITDQVSQSAIQKDVTTQMEEVRGWLSGITSPDAKNGQISLAPVQQRLQQDARQLTGDVSSKVQQLSMTIQAWVPNEKEITNAHVAQVQLTENWQAWHQANMAIDRQPGLASGVWATALAPLRTELGQVDIQTLSSVYAPKTELASLQKQWSDRLIQYATTAKKLASQAAQDTSLNSAARQAIADWSQPLQETAEASRVLASALSTRVSAQSWPASFSSVSAQANLALGDMSNEKDVRHAQWLMSGGGGLLILGALGLGLGLRKQGVILQEIERQHQTSMASRRSIERLTRQMRQVMRADMSGESSRSRLEESIRNPGHALATLVNQVLDMREGVVVQISENEDKVARVIQGLRRQVKDLEQAARERQVRIDQAAQHHLLQAQGLAALGQQVRRCLDQASNIWEGFRNSQGAVQETTWKTEAIRTKSQGAAKRIKRVAESTQSISVSMDVIRQLDVRIQLLSFNAAIEAPMAGGTGRNLAVLVREIQGLAQSTDETVKETEMVVRDIQEDAKQAVATMEQNTEDVVDANKRAAQAGATLQGIERQAEGMVDILNRLAEALETRAIDDADLAETDKRDRAAVDRMIEQTETIHEAFDTLTQSGQAGALAIRQRLNRLPSS